MSRDIFPDVLERLAGIRETQRKIGGCSRGDALSAARDALDRAQGPDDEDRRRWLTFAAAWALYALELHDAATRPTSTIRWADIGEGTEAGYDDEVFFAIVYPHETGGWGWTVYTTPPDVEPAHGVCEFRPDAFAAAEEAHRGAGGRT